MEIWLYGNSCSYAKSTKSNLVETGKLQYIILLPRTFSLLGQVMFLIQIKHPIILIKVTIVYEEKNNTERMVSVKLCYKTPPTLQKLTS